MLAIELGFEKGASLGYRAARAASRAGYGTSALVGGALGAAGGAAHAGEGNRIRGALAGGAIGAGVGAAGAGAARHYGVKARTNRAADRVLARGKRDVMTQATRNPGTDSARGATTTVTHHRKGQTPTRQYKHTAQGWEDVPRIGADSLIMHGDDAMRQGVGLQQMRQSGTLGPQVFTARPTEFFGRTARGTA